MPLLIRRRTKIMIKIFFFGIILCWSTAEAFAWTNGELLIWISGNRAYHALVELGKVFDPSSTVSDDFF
jgi:hypothetical protein